MNNARAVLRIKTASTEDWDKNTVLVQKRQDLNVTSFYQINAFLEMRMVSIAATMSSDI